MTDRYAVFGNPLGHSKSPLIHTRFAQECGQDLSYEKIEPPIGGFATAFRQFVTEGGKGCNVTAPFKLEVFSLATTKTANAALAGAANTMRFNDGVIEAHNTDGIGLLADIERLLGTSLRGTRILLLGAGGAARGAALPILNAAPAVFAMINRTPSRAMAIRKALLLEGHAGPTLLDLGTAERFDIVINATSASLSGECPEVPTRAFEDCSLAYDLAYGKGLTPFLARAREVGVPRLADGVGMLVEQAAEAFEWWRGMRPSTHELIEELTVPLR